MTRIYVRLAVADVIAVLEALNMAGARLDGARFHYVQRGVPIDNDIREEVEAARDRLTTGREALRKLLTDHGVRP